MCPQYFCSHINGNMLFLLKQPLEVSNQLLHMANDYYQCIYYHHYHCHLENNCGLRVKLFFNWYFFFIFYPKKHPFKPSWFFSTFFQIANILVVWCFAFFLANIILFFLIHNRSNRSRSVLIVRKFNGKEFPVTFFSGKYLKCPKLIRIQGTATYFISTV